MRAKNRGTDDHRDAGASDATKGETLREAPGADGPRVGRQSSARRVGSRLAGSDASRRSVRGVAGVAYRFAGEFVRARRLERGLSLADVASACGCTEGSVRLWESGQPPRAMAVRPLMRVLGCTLDQLLPAVRA